MWSKCVSYYLLTVEGIECLKSYIYNLTSYNQSSYNLASPYILYSVCVPYMINNPSIKWMENLSA